MAGPISHFLQPEHKLQISDKTNNYRCDMCKVISRGRRYRCDTCDFDLHESCATYPQTLHFFLAHPWHTLSIAADDGMGRFCDLCLDVVKGFYYRCVLCGFDMHLHCSLLSQTVKTEHHPAHPLMLVPGAPGCAVCNQYKGFWFYECGLCSVRFHVKCLNVNSQNHHGHMVKAPLGGEVRT